MGKGSGVGTNGGVEHTETKPSGAGTVDGHMARAGAVGVLMACCAVAVWAYRPGMSGGFYFDDEQNIVDAVALHWSGLSVDAVRTALTDAQLPRRPVANLSFALNHLWAGLDPGPYHWTNLVIHLAVGLTVAWICLVYLSRATRAPPSDAWTWLLAAMVAGLFLLHPINIQATTYVVQRMAALSALFTFLSFGLYMLARGGSRRRPALFLASGVCWLLALGSKETAAALPVAVLIYEWCLHREAWRARLEGWGRARWLLPVLLAVVGAIGVLAVIYQSPDLASWNETLTGRDFSGAERVLTQSRVQFFYLGLMLWPTPARLNLEHDFAVSTGLFTPWSTAAALGGWAVVVTVGLWLARRRPALGFPVLAYLAFHTLESGPINLEMVFEHRMYLPLGFLCLGLATAGAALHGRTARSLTVVVALALLVPLALATEERNRTWGDTLTFLRDCAAKSPAKFRPHYNLGTELGYGGDFTGAEAALRRALVLKPDNSLAHNQLANVLLLTGRGGEALRHYEQAVEFDPQNVEALYNLARQMDARGLSERALPLYRRFLELAGPRFGPQREWVKARIKRREGRSGHPAPS